MPAMERYGQQLEAQLRSMLSTAFPPPSEPGESPHRRSGHYVGSVSHTTESLGDQVRTTTGVKSKIGPYLEHGTERMAARPHHQKLRDIAIREAAGAVASLLMSGI